MKKKVILLILIILAILLVVFGLVVLNKNRLFEKNKIQIIDATYNKTNGYQKIYEDSEYSYYLTGSNSDSVYVKFANGNKILVVRALSDGKVSMNELINAGLEVYKERK